MRTVAAVGRAVAEDGLKQRVGVCGAGGVGHGGDVGGPVGVESWDAAVAAVGDAVKGGACETGWIGRYRARTGTSAVQRLGAAASGGEMGAASAAAPAVCGDRYCLHFFPRHQLHRACRPQQLLLCWRSGKGSAPACPKKTPQSSV